MSVKGGRRSDGNTADTIPEAVHLFSKALEERANVVVKLATVPVTVRLVPHGLEHMPQSDIRYVRFKFHLEPVVTLEEISEIEDDHMPGLPDATLSFTFDSKQSMMLNFERLHDFVTRQVSSMLSERTDVEVEENAGEETVKQVSVGFVTISAALIATMILVVNRSGPSNMIGLGVVGVVAFGIGLLAGAHTRALQLFDAAKSGIMNWGFLRRAFSPWRKVGVAQRCLRYLERRRAERESSDDQHGGIESLLKLDPPMLDGSGDAGELQPQLLFELGLRLSQLAGKLEAHPERRRRLQQALRRTLDSFQRDRNVERKMIAVAHTVQLRRWAVECLPSLFIAVQEGAETCVFLAWLPMVAFLKTREFENKWRVNRLWCDGLVAEIEGSRECYEVLKARAAPLFEGLRREFPFGSAGAMTGAIVDTLCLLEQEDRREGRTAEAERLASVREAFLIKENLGYE